MKKNQSIKPLTKTEKSVPTEKAVCLEKSMDTSATWMAVYFNNTVTNSQIARWLADAGGFCKTFPQKSDPIREIDPQNFLYRFGRDVLPYLIDCKSSEDRISTLKDELTMFLSHEGYDRSKLALTAIGKSFLKSLEVYNDNEGIMEFMNIYATWLEITEVFHSFEWDKHLLNEERRKVAEEKNKAA